MSFMSLMTSGNFRKLVKLMQVAKNGVCHFHQFHQFHEFDNFRILMKLMKLVKVVLK